MFKLAEKIPEYMQLRVPHARHTGVGICRALAGTKATPQEMFPRFVHAMLEANASCSESFCVDNVGQFVNVAGVRAVQHAKRRDDVFAAE